MIRPWERRTVVRWRILMEDIDMLSCSKSIPSTINKTGTALSSLLTNMYNSNIVIVVSTYSDRPLVVLVAHGVHGVLMQ